MRCELCDGWGHDKYHCPKAKPGSVLALVHNCTCPTIDNRYGAGATTDPTTGEVLYWQNSECPLHGSRDEKEQE